MLPTGKSLYRTLLRGIGVTIAFVIPAWVYAIGDKIRNQVEFDAAMAAITAGQIRDLQLTSGTYLLKQPIIATAPLRISGNNVTIRMTDVEFSPEDAVGRTDTHLIYALSSHIGPFALFLDEKGAIIPISESVEPATLVNQTENDIEGAESRVAGLELKIPLVSNLAHLVGQSFSAAYGYFDCGWDRINVTVERADRHHLYCTTLNTSNVPSYNYEKTAYKNKIRYVVYNAEIKEGAIYYTNKMLYVPKSVGVVRCLKNARNDTFSITAKSDLYMSGISFDGIKGVRVINAEKNKCIIKKCSFRNVLGTTLSVSKNNKGAAERMIIEQCDFRNCSLLQGNVMFLSSGYSETPCIEVKKCIVERYGTKHPVYKNCSGAISVYGDVLVENCAIRNSCRDHFFLAKGHITIRDCSIYNSDAFNESRYRNLSNDWGGIYCNHFTSDSQVAMENTQNQILIEGCLIHGMYAFAKDARGIMIDDGRGDVTCKHNIIFDCQSYTIDSREVANYIGTSSVRNVIEENLLGSRYHIAGGKDIPKTLLPYRSGNFVVANSNNVFNGNVRTGVEDREVDKNIFRSSGAKVKIDRPTRKLLKKAKGHKRLKRWLK